ncbi:Long-chain-fatty-acid--CoA ligase ACSBG2 [Geodia barretti]|uniref:long-chain-fatty-acid--CoA ligase n=1 Tax=Geodia barretti TaxID=519541 RepID=A0AA35S374_GEOBA|nr:Long-chain-fatty-acid--CoA ligase ACSBG2 [Geodia barretti]
MNVKKIVEKALRETLVKLGVQAPPPTVVVKFSGDGAVIASSATMVFLTFSFPGLSENVLSAIVLAIMMGINKANSTYACVWCTVAKDERMGYKCTRESVGSLLQTMKEIRPTIFLRVPSWWPALRANSSPGYHRWPRTLASGPNYNKQLGGSGTPFGWTIVNVVFFKKVRQALGLDRCRFPMAGGAPMAQETLTYFMSINIPVHEIYGMSETTGPTTLTTSDKIRFMSSGRPFGGIKGVGEVLVSGRHVFMGYMGNTVATSEEGYLYITGRMKEIIITASGEKVPPRPIEEAITRELPLISDAIVIGDQQRFLCCLVTLKTEVDEETGVPTLSCCQAVGNSAHTVQGVVGGEGDRKVLKMIQHGIHEASKV